MAHDRASFGKASLWASIIGIAVPVGLALIAVIFFVFLNSRGGPGAVVVSFGLLSAPILGAILEMAAFGCGIVARSTATGKAGLKISCAGLVALVPLVFWVFSWVLR